MYKALCFLILFGSPLFAASLTISVDGEAKGEIKIDLFEEVAPLHVTQILNLAEAGLYNNVVFHRVIDGFMAQTGDAVSYTHLTLPTTVFV